MPTSDPVLAYEQTLARRGYAADAVARRLRLARAILAALDPGDPQAQRYRNAVERVLARCDNPATEAWCQKIAREFHAFYVDAGCPLPPQARPQPPLPRIDVELPPHEGLDDLVRLAMDFRLRAEDRSALSVYDAQLKQARIDRPGRQHRLTVARLLLMAMQGLPRDGRHYRAVIDRLLPYFTRAETRAFFLAVARELYPLILPPKRK